jgi:hypothetical protein
VVTFARRFAAVAVVLALSAGNLAICAGWQATPEARMECCKNGTSCPMHKSESHRSGSKRAITQTPARPTALAAEIVDVTGVSRVVEKDREVMTISERR